VQSYDHVGRLVSATGTPSQVSSLPYNQSYGYDAFGNATSRYGAYYYQSYSSDGGTYQNNRRQDLTYDADGHVTHTPSYNNMGSVVSFRDWTYDAAGLMVQVKETVTANNSVSTYVTNHDGDGQPISEYYQENLGAKSFMVRSSLIGGEVLTGLDNSGNKSSTVFSVDGLLTTVQNVSSYGSSLRWTHIDPLGLSEAGDTKAVYDPMGNYIPWQHAPTYPPPNAYPPIAASYGGLGPSFGYAINSACILDGIPTDCSLALNNLAHGSAEQCPNNYCGAGRARNGDLVPLTRDPDTGQLGYYSAPQQKTPTLDPKVQQALSDCIDELWNGAVKLTSFKPSTKTRHGRASFDYDVAGNGRRGSATIENDSTSYSAAQLDGFAQMAEGGSVGKIHPGDALGLTLGNKNNPPTFRGQLSFSLPGGGAGLWFSPFENFTANDRQRFNSDFVVMEKSMGKIPMTQAYELANSIGVIIDWKVGSESGASLASCMTKKLKPTR
jgi:hypothetical protein